MVFLAFLGVHDLPRSIASQLLINLHSFRCYSLECTERSSGNGHVLRIFTSPEVHENVRHAEASSRVEVKYSKARDDTYAFQTLNPLNSNLTFNTSGGSSGGRLRRIITCVTLNFSIFSVYH